MDRMEVKGSKILVVDDEPMNVELLDAYLSAEGYEVVTAYSGEEALEKVESEKPALILLDVMMPGLNGFEVCKLLKGKEETRFIPVVMVTALRELEDKIKGIESGADDFLTKPVTSLELLTRVKSLLRIKYLHDELIERKLRQIRAENELLQRELKIAQEIQQSFLPKTMPEIKGVELAAFNLPAREVGGDFYDFIPIAKDMLGFVIADVSGKGIPAALFMAQSRTLVRASAARNPTAANVIREANKLIFEDSKSNMFVTLFYTILDSKKMCLRYVNAGHSPPLLLCETPGDIVFLKAKGIALGVIDEVELQEVEIELTSGDIIVLYTDGVTEAIDENEEQFGQEKLIRVISENRNLSAHGIIGRVDEKVKEFAGKQSQFDDITLIILKVT